MKKIYKIILTIIILIGIGIATIQVFGESGNEKLKCITIKDPYQKYECEVQNICKKNEYGKNDKKIAIPKNDKYTKKMTYDEALKKFKKDQTQIYECGELESNRRAKKNTKDTLKLGDKNGEITSAILPEVDKELNKIKQQKSKNQCRDIKDGSAIKSTLDQSTLEYCKFKFFTNYLIDNEEKALEKNIKGKDRVGYTTMKKNIGELKEQINETDGLIKRTILESFKNLMQYNNYQKIHEQLTFHASILRIINKHTKSTLRIITQNSFNSTDHQSAE